MSGIRLRGRVRGKLVAVLLVIGAVAGVEGAQGASSLDAFAGHIVSAGPPKDGIPAIDAPKFISAGEANRVLDDQDIVFGINRNGLVQAYPQDVLVWHEIVNQKFKGEDLALTYCPLTGSAVGYLATALGVSGKLLNSNLVMYDRATDSLWPQVLGVAIAGSQKATSLPSYPVVWTTWGRWKKAFPNTEVLSRNTGFIRSYGKDPYGSYGDQASYYTSGAPLFPVMHRDNRLDAKEVVVGVESGGKTLAVPKDVLRERKLVTARLGNEAIAVIYDAALDDGLAYRTGDRQLTVREGKVVDERGAAYDVWGRSSRGDPLAFVRSFDVMWFAWVGFHPDTALVVGAS